MGFKKISELDMRYTVNGTDLFTGVSENNGDYDNYRYKASDLKTYFQEGVQQELTFDNAPTENSQNPVTSGGLYSKFNTKQDKLTFDDAPSVDSQNPVTSEGIALFVKHYSVPQSFMGAPYGVAELDSGGKVPSAQLPSYVDDVLEYATRSAFPYTGEGGKIYIALNTNLVYRWSGSTYVEISSSLALGETSSTAYRGDRGKAAYDFSRSPYSASPSMNGSASAGQSNYWSRGDHVHPHDSTKQDVLTFDNTPTESSQNPVTSGGLYSKFNTKQDVLTFDNTPTKNSNNPVKSNGIYDAILKLYPVDTASGNPASFTDGADDVPVVDLSVEIPLTQPGSGLPSQENVRPITLRTGLILSHSGADTSDPEELVISWENAAGTIIAGALDITTGVLSITQVDYSAEVWANSAANATTSAYVQAVFTPQNQDLVVGKAWSDRFSMDYASGVANKMALITNMGAYRLYYNIPIDELSDTTTEAIRDWLATEHPQFVFEYETPVTVQLTPIQINTLLGKNNIWSDTGDVTVEYRADIKKYIGGGGGQGVFAFYNRINTGAGTQIIIHTTTNYQLFFIVGQGGIHGSVTAMNGNTPVGNIAIASGSVAISKSGENDVKLESLGTYKNILVYSEDDFTTSVT